MLETSTASSWIEGIAGEIMAWLQREKPIYLYGYSRFDFTIDKKKKLEDAGFTVLGYIDRDAATIREKYNVPCYTIDEIPEAVGQRADIQVVIMLQNARLHEEVKKELECAGFHRILLAPLSIESEEQRFSLMTFECFWENDFDETGKYDFVEVAIDDVWVSETGKLRNHELRRVEEYFSIIEYGLGKDVDLTAYLAFMGKSDKEFLEDRKQLIVRLDTLYTTNPEYFRLASIHACWKNEHWLLIDGLHRAAFFVYKGEKKIPLRARKNDIQEYLKWKSQKGE